MGKNPEFRRNDGMRRLGRLAWVPVPALLAAIVALWLADLQGSHESHFLGIALNIVFSTVASLFVAYLIGRSFLVRGTAGLLLLGCGVVLWGLAGVVATAVAGNDVNVLIAIHNSCVWLSALCHLASVLLSLRPRRTLSPAGLWLPAAYAHGAVVVALIALSARAGWLPTFFIQGQGGTPLRQFVLGSAVGMFGLTALLLAVTSRRPLSPFAYWYALALALIAVGLFGVMLESSVASLLGWTGRGTQFVSGVYMLIAAVASVRESRVWGISLEAALREERDFSSAVLDTAGALVVVLDAQGRITRFNRACEQLTGYPAADVLGRVFWDFLVPPDDMAGVMETWKSLNAGSFPSRHENHWLTRDGTRRLIDWSNTALTDEAGEVRHIVAIGINVTERRQAEEALRENQALVHAVVGGSPDLIYMKDLNGRVLMANPAACKALGRLAEEVIRKTAREFHRDDPDVGRAIIENDRRIMESGTTETIEELGLEGRTYLSTKAPCRNAAGKVVGLIGISHDITDRKQAEKALRESEERYRTLFETAPDAIVVHRDGRVLYANDAVLRLVGLSDSEELASHTVFDFFRPQEREQVAERIRLAMAGHRLPAREAALRRLDGQEVVVEFHTAPVDFRGVPAVQTIIRDITERKRAEEALRVSESATREQAARLQTVMEAAPAIIWIAHDRDCRSITGNRAAREFLRVPDGDVNLSKTGPAPERLAHYRVFADGVELQPQDMPIQVVARSGKELGERAIQFRFDDGATRSLIGNIIPLFDGQGQPGGAIAAFLDVTERKRAEEALRELNATLEGKVAQRTAELEHRAKQLQKLTLELTQAEDRERKRIAEILHEDLQQHIAGAKFHLSLLSHRVRDDPSQRAIVDRVDEMLKEAIQKSRSLSHDLSPAVLHMNDLGEVFRWLASRMKTKHGLIVRMDIRGEPTLQSEVLTMFLFRTAQEMLFNVIKHAEVHEAAIRVRRLGRYLCLSVLDRGCGFDPRKLKETSGFGLLSIRERVELLGGRMTIKSVKGRGSRFHIIIPDGKLDAGSSEVALDVQPK